MTTPNNQNDRPGDLPEGIPAYGDYSSGNYPSGDSADQSGPYEAAGNSYAASGNAYPGHSDMGQQNSSWQDNSWQAQDNKPSVLALVAFIFGLLCIPAAFFGLSIIPGVIGLVLAIIALIINRKKDKSARRTWMSVVGLVLSILGIVFSVIIVGLLAYLLGNSNIGDCISKTDPSARQACLEKNLDIKSS